MHRGFAPILIILLGLTLVALGSITYFYLQLKPQPSPTPSSIASPTPTDETVYTDEESANWKTYNNILYGFSVRYPPNLTPREGEPSDLYLFSISFSEPQKVDFSGFSVEVQTGTLEDIVQIEKWRIVGHVADNIKSETKIKKGEYDGVRLEYEYLAGPVDKPESKIEVNAVVILAKGKYIYKLSSKSDFMDQILSTFKFLD